VAETPGWANGNKGKTQPPTNVNDFGDFMSWATGQYPAVKAWQIYNEPNNGDFWSSTTAQYVNVLKAGYAGVKSVNASDVVVTGGITFNNAAGWVAEIYANGAKGHFDAIGTHPYQVKADEPPEYAADANTWWFPNNTPAVRQVMVNNGDSAAKIWITEFGYSSHSNATVPAGTDYWWALGVTDAQQADFAVRAIKYVRANWPYVDAFFWYRERSNPLGSLSPDWFDLHTQNYALLRTDLSERPVLGALKQYLTTP
jgi:hypothetical protein